MPPSVSFTKEQIVEVAYRLSVEAGVEALTIRTIAHSLGSSIAPIYSNFASLEEVKAQVMQKAFAWLEQYTEKAYSSSRFLNIGLGLLDFARDNKLLYRSLFINNNDYAYLVKEFFDRNLKEAGQDHMLDELDADEKKRVLEKIRLFTHGLATMICSGNMQDRSEEYTRQLLKDAGEDIVGYTIYQHRQLQKKNADENKAQKRGME